MEWTPEQLNLYKAVPNGESLIIDAVAGSGKTTSLKEVGKQIKVPMLAVAFNVKIKKTLEEAIPNATVKTLNGLGHGALVKFIGKRPTVDSYKVGKITTQVLKDNGIQDQESWDIIRRLVSHAKSAGLVPRGSGPGSPKSLIEDNYNEWDNLATFYDLDFDSTLHELAHEVLVRSNRQVFVDGIIDYDDQLYISICWNATFQRYPVVLVDEAQDLSPIQHIMLERSLILGGQLIAVGDPHQAIYGFRGALSNSMELLQDRFSMTTMPLSFSFRCGKAIITKAQKYVPHIKAPDWQIDGEVRKLSKYSKSEFQHGDAILCRFNGPLIAMAYKLLKQGVGVHMLGRDIGAGLKRLVKTLGSSTIEQLETDLETWAQREIALAKAKGKFDKVEKIEDKRDSLAAVISHSGAKSIEELVNLIDNLFGRESAPITLGTGHRAKGLEWDRVFFLDSWRIPSKYATQDWQLQQEDNLAYVIITRARKVLTYINLDHFQE